MNHVSLFGPKLSHAGLLKLLGAKTISSIRQSLRKYAHARSAPRRRPGLQRLGTSWLFRPACRRRSESARAGSEKSLQIIFAME
jgi:hypothetical protein